MGALYPNLWGNVVALLVSALVAIVGSLVSPDNEFKWSRYAHHSHS